MIRDIRGHALSGATAKSLLHYETAVRQEQTQKLIAGDLLQRVFGGSAKSLVMGALSAKPASSKELANIREMLDAFAKKKGPSQ